MRQKIHFCRAQTPENTVISGFARFVTKRNIGVVGLECCTAPYLQVVKQQSAKRRHKR